MMAFLGVFIGCMFLPRLGDLYGRKPVFLISMLIQSPVMLSLTFTRSMPLIYFEAFIIGVCIIGRMSCGFLLLME